MKRLVPAAIVAARPRGARLAIAMPLLAALLAAFAGGASAATTDGTLITNIASATFQGPGNSRGFIMTYCSSAYVLVQNPAIMLFKTANPTMQAPGGDVTFRSCVRNTATDMSAFNVSVTDAIPAGFQFQLGGATGSSPGVWPNTWVITNANGLAGPWLANWPGIGQQPAWFMRWTIPVLGPNSSGCVEFNARVL